ncbi:hypothetical protein CHELA1G11_30116 [Hyphomicrobiales bacterium]|nr:hypothetical protein CHELA1G2_30105 [Hyphomicrobiales bacterium]CAH1696250.1 hypothetical protein CHELA1G11_30116 [Hyphomicrobiales bacterium]
MFIEPLSSLADPKSALLCVRITHTLDGRLTFNIIDGFDSTNRSALGQRKTRQSRVSQEGQRAGDANRQRCLVNAIES